MDDHESSNAAGWAPPPFPEEIFNMLSSASRAATRAHINLLEGVFDLHVANAEDPNLDLSAFLAHFGRDCQRIAAAGSMIKQGRRSISGAASEVKRLRDYVSPEPLATHTINAAAGDASCAADNQTWTNREKMERMLAIFAFSAQILDPELKSVEKLAPIVSVCFLFTVIAGTASTIDPDAYRELTDLLALPTATLGIVLAVMALMPRDHDR